MDCIRVVRVNLTYAYVGIEIHLARLGVCNRDYAEDFALDDLSGAVALNTTEGAATTRLYLCLNPNGEIDCEV